MAEVGPGGHRRFFAFNATVGLGELQLRNHGGCMDQLKEVRVCTALCQHGQARHPSSSSLKNSASTPAPVPPIVSKIVAAEATNMSIATAILRWLGSKPWEVSVVFVVAWKSGNKEITYRDQSGKTLFKRGGSRSWRNNNPGNIIDGPFAEDHGAIGDDTKMAVFPDESVGREAVKALLTGKKYRNLSIRDAMYRYAPPSDNNDTDAYIAAITKAVGVPASTIIKDLWDRSRCFRGSHQET